MRPSNNLENKTLSNTFWRVYVVWMRVPAHSSLKKPLEYNKDQTPVMNKDSFGPV